MATVKVSVTTTKQPLNPGEAPGLMRFTLQSSDGTTTWEDVPGVEAIFPRVRVGEHTMTVVRLDVNGIELSAVISQPFSVALDQVETYNAPSVLSIVVMPD